MLPEKIMQSDTLDILFENRNKTYGAYALRKSYNKTMASAISITVFIAMAFCIFQFTHHSKEKIFATQIIIPPDNEFSKIEPEKKQPEAPSPQHVSTRFNQEIYSAPVIAKDIPETQMPTINVLDKSIIGDTKIIGDDATNETPPANTTQAAGEVTVQPAKPITEDKPLTKAEVMPEFPGGIEALKKFMLRNLSQPDDFAAGEKTVVIASFIVNKNGEIEEVKIINNGRADLNKEVKRVINKMPFWKPGMQNGNPVSVYFNLPVTFMSAEE